MGTQLSLTLKGRSLPIFGPCLLWLKSWMDQDVIWYGGRSRPRPHCARWGPSSPSPKGHSPLPPFSAHICCGQMARWIKMPLGRKLGLSPSDIVLDGDPAPRPKRERSLPTFGPCLLWLNGWMDQDATWYGGGPRPSDVVLDGDPAPPKRCTASSFRPMSIVAKRLDG